MAIQERTATTASDTQNPATITSIAVNKPVGAAAGDGVTIVVQFAGTIATLGTVVVPTGFVTRHSLGATLVITKTLDGTEGATFTVSWDTALFRVVIACHAVYDDAGGTMTYDDVVAAQDTGTGHAVGPLNVNRANSILVVCSGQNSATTATYAPGGSLAERAEIEVATGATGFTSAWLATELQAAAGSSGVKAFTTSASITVRTALLAFYVPGSGSANLLLMGVG